MRSMPGYDTHGPQYPTAWDEKELDLIHSEIDIINSCDGVIEEYTEKPNGYPIKVFYRCEGCGKDVTTEVLNYDRDSTDWEYDYV